MHTEQMPCYASMKAPLLQNAVFLLFMYLHIALCESQTQRFLDVEDFLSTHSMYAETTFLLDLVYIYYGG